MPEYPFIAKISSFDEDEAKKAQSFGPTIKTSDGDHDRGNQHHGPGEQDASDFEIKIRHGPSFSVGLLGSLRPV
jgi:hypothetical protein